MGVRPALNGGPLIRLGYECDPSRGNGSRPIARGEWFACADRVSDPLTLHEHVVNIVKSKGNCQRIAGHEGATPVREAADEQVALVWVEIEGPAQLRRHAVRMAHSKSPA